MEIIIGLLLAACGGIAIGCIFTAILPFPVNAFIAVPLGGFWGWWIMGQMIA